MENRLRTLVASVGLAIVLGAGLTGVLAPTAQAGGGNIHYIFGATPRACANNLNTSIRLYRSNDYVVTGVHGCRLAGDQKRYFGDFVANPR